MCRLPCRRRGRGKPSCRHATLSAPVLAVPRGRVPRVTRLLSLALRFDGLVRAGLIADYATLAELGHVSRARISQIMNLLVLAPDNPET
jgi:hypothetical protein